MLAVSARHPQRQVVISGAAVDLQPITNVTQLETFSSMKMSQPTFDLSRVSLANDLCNNILQN